MFDFIGETCPVCSEKFLNSDDIVVCPVCGAPHHRVCYVVENKCMFSGRHGDGFTWAPSADSRFAEETEDQNDRTAAFVCPSCGNDSNPRERFYCQRCGAPMRIPPTDTVNPNAVHLPWAMPNQAEPERTNSFFAVGSNPTISDGVLIDDIPVGDLRRFIGATWYYYIPMFLQIAHLFRRFSLNLSAFLFTGVWFIYRKMYALGIMITILIIACSGLEAYIYSSIPALRDGGDMISGFAEHPVAVLFLGLCALLPTGIMIFCGIAGNNLYMRHCVSRIKKINSGASSAEDFNEKLEKIGGVSMLPAAFAGIVCVAVNYFALNIFAVLA